MGNEDAPYCFEITNIKQAPEVEAISKAEYKARLTELISMAVRVKYNTESIDMLIDILDIWLSEVEE